MRVDSAEPDVALDFDARRALRRRILETLEDHQKREADTVVKCADELVDHLQGCLNILGSYLVRSIDEEMLMPHFVSLVGGEYATWREYHTAVEFAETSFSEAEEQDGNARQCLNAIEPSSIKRVNPWHEKRDELERANDVVKAAKFRKDKAESALMASKSKFRRQTRLVLERAAARVEHSSIDAPWSKEIQVLSIERLGAARQRWLDHLHTEHAGLADIIECAYTLSRTGANFEVTL